MKWYRFLYEKKNITHDIIQIFFYTSNLNYYYRMINLKERSIYETDDLWLIDWQITLVLLIDKYINTPGCIYHYMYVLVVIHYDIEYKGS